MLEHYDKSYMYNSIYIWDKLQNFKDIKFVPVNHGFKKIHGKKKT